MNRGVTTGRVVEDLGPSPRPRQELPIRETQAEETCQGRQRPRGVWGSGLLSLALRLPWGRPTDLGHLTYSLGLVIDTCSLCKCFLSAPARTQMHTEKPMGVGQSLNGYLIIII